MSGLDDIDDDELEAAMEKRRARKDKDLDALADKVTERIKKALGIDGVEDDEGGNGEKKPAPKKRSYFG